jgi:ribosomal protein S18 acetylase RimI-like enzyme
MLYVKPSTRPQISIRRAGARDAKALTVFAAQAFRDAFGAENTPHNMERYMTDAFSLERQAAEIADPTGAVLLAERAQQGTEDGLVGYARLVTGAPPSAVDPPLDGQVESPAIELRRLYVDRRWHGAGVGRVLMDAVVAAAQDAGARTIWLAVWQRNARAIRFYEKCGFTRTGSTRFLLGDDEQTDWLMARPV